jgi:hypothetical protein
MAGQEALSTKIVGGEMIYNSVIEGKSFRMLYRWKKI